MIKKIFFWISNTLFYFLNSLQKIIFHLRANSTDKKLGDIWKIPGPLHLPLLGTKWIFFWKYKVEKIHEAYNGKFLYIY